MSVLDRFNIVYGGHMEYEALRDNIDMLRAVLEDCGLSVDVSETVSPNKQNLIYEGHHPMFWDNIFEMVKNNGVENIYLICTEEIVGSKFLPKIFFTFNNFDLFSVSKWKLFFHPIRLLFFNFRYWCTKMEQEENITFRYRFLNRLKINETDIMWKERYNYFLKLSSMCHGHISTYDENYGYFGFKNSFYLPHLFTNKDFENTLPNTSKIMYDCVFTGAITPHRRYIIKLLRDAGLKVAAPGIIEDKERWKLVNSSRLILGLLKSPNQYTSSTNRTFLALQNNKIIINELPRKNDYLDEFVFTCSTENIVSYTLAILKNFDTRILEFRKLRIEALTKFNSMNYKNNIKSYFKLN